MPELWRVAVRARSDDAERRRAELLELSPDGLEERSLEGGVVELAIYVHADRRPAVTRALGAATVTAVEPGWEDGWRAFHRPVEVGGLWLGPPWESPPDPQAAVVIDPGQAFGTGSHPTTRLCVELLAETPVRGSLLDVGCGSGVLAIAGVRLGFDPVLAIDSDPVAVATTRANATANGVAFEVSLVDAFAEQLPTADVGVANVLLEPVERILARLDASVAITSGYLAGERPAHTRWAHVDAVERDGWAADRFTRAQRRVDQISP